MVQNTRKVPEPDISAKFSFGPFWSFLVIFGHFWSKNELFSIILQNWLIFFDISHGVKGKYMVKSNPGPFFRKMVSKWTPSSIAQNCSIRFS